MTEDEAHTKWCPFGRVPSKHGVSPNATVNRGREEKEWTYCIASACMAWRWNTVPNPDWRADHSMVFPQPNPYTKPSAGIPSTTSGHCGLAGA